MDNQGENWNYSQHLKNIQPGFKLVGRGQSIANASDKKKFHRRRRQRQQIAYLINENMNYIISGVAIWQIITRNK